MRRTSSRRRSRSRVSPRRSRSTRARTAGARRIPPSTKWTMRRRRGLVFSSCTRSCSARQPTPLRARGARAAFDDDAHDRRRRLDLRRVRRCRRRITNILRDLSGNSKDAALAFGARRVINARINRIGVVTELFIDTKSQSMQLRLQLRGETQPIDVQVKKYRLEQAGNQATLMIVEATASREWVDGALQEFVVGRRFEIPPTVASVLKLLT